MNLYLPFLLLSTTCHIVHLFDQGCSFGVGSGESLFLSFILNFLDFEDRGLLKTETNDTRFTSMITLELP
ncbi:unnamed protein product [Citrullus colocynthis]|uniref:Uncharacterized protein n=1 Tax=Citrullus colocynthis TaxID=252529 RepID=A0ABP0XZL9_9ROSI